VDPIGRNAVFFGFKNDAPERPFRRTWRIQVFRQPLSVLVLPPREAVTTILARIRETPGRTPLPTAAAEEYGTDDHHSVMSVQNATGRTVSLLLSPGDGRYSLSPNATQEIPIAEGVYEIGATPFGKEEVPAYGTLVINGATRYRLRFH
jgi:hypothetical protein